MLNFDYEGCDEAQCRSIHRTWACEIIVIFELILDCRKFANLCHSPMTISNIFLLRMPGAFFTLH